VKAFYWNRKGLLEKLHEASDEAMRKFPEIVEVRLFGSLAQGTETGLSDVDIFLLLTESAEKNPIERMKPYYNFFSDKIEVALDMIVAVRDELDQFKNILKGSILLCGGCLRRGGSDE
jgi:predicted nucleotidyltransferase